MTPWFLCGIRILREQRQPYVSDAGQAVEAFLHHANHRVWYHTNSNGLADEQWIGVEAPFPVVARQQHDLWTVWPPVFIRREVSPQHDTRAQRREIAPFRNFRLHAFGIVVGANRYLEIGVQR